MIVKIPNELSLMMSVGRSDRYYKEHLSTPHSDTVSKPKGAVSSDHNITKAHHSTYPTSRASQVNRTIKFKRWRLEHGVKIYDSDDDDDVSNDGRSGASNDADQKLETYTAAEAEVSNKELERKAELDEEAEIAAIWKQVEKKALEELKESVDTSDVTGSSTTTMSVTKENESLSIPLYSSNPTSSPAHPFLFLTSLSLASNGLLKSLPLSLYSEDPFISPLLQLPLLRPELRSIADVSKALEGIEMWRHQSTSINHSYSTVLSSESTNEGLHDADYTTTATEDEGVTLISSPSSTTSSSSSHPSLPLDSFTSSLMPLSPLPSTLTSNRMSKEISSLSKALADSAIQREYHNTYHDSMYNPDILFPPTLLHPLVCGDTASNVFASRLRDNGVELWASPPSRYNLINNYDIYPDTTNTNPSTCSTTNTTTSTASATSADSTDDHKDTSDQSRNIALNAGLTLPSDLVLFSATTTSNRQLHSPGLSPGPGVNPIRFMSTSRYNYDASLSALLYLPIPSVSHCLIGPAFAALPPIAPSDHADFSSTPSSTSSSSSSSKSSFGTWLIGSIEPLLTGTTFTRTRGEDSRDICVSANTTENHRGNSSSISSSHTSSNSTTSSMSLSASLESGLTPITNNPLNSLVTTHPSDGPKRGLHLGSVTSALLTSNNAASSSTHLRSVDDLNRSTGNGTKGNTDGRSSASPALAFPSSQLHLYPLTTKLAYVHRVVAATLVNLQRENDLLIRTLPHVTPSNALSFVASPYFPTLSLTDTSRYSVKLDATGALENMMDYNISSQYYSSVPGHTINTPQMLMGGVPTYNTLPLLLLSNTFYGAHSQSSAPRGVGTPVHATSATPLGSSSHPSSQFYTTPPFTTCHSSAGNGSSNSNYNSSGSKATHNTPLVRIVIHNSTPQPYPVHLNASTTVLGDHVQNTNDNYNEVIPGYSNLYKTKKMIIHDVAGMVQIVLRYLIAVFLSIPIAK